MLEATSRIRHHVEGVVKADFLNGSTSFDAVAMNIVVIGESVVHLPPDLKAGEPETPWRQIVASRNLVAHGYPELDPDVIWTIVATQLDDLDAVTKRMIARLEGL
ncbi:MAG TPA: DUF86 domain-containing protein [Caulobacter sp.]|nr:DUF86 domain-containing protein [Caulobacter sp.]